MPTPPSRTAPPAPAGARAAAPRRVVRRALAAVPGCAAALLLAFAVAGPVGAQPEGPATQIFAVDPALEPIPEPCYLATCPPPRYAFGALPGRFVPLGAEVFFVADDRVHGAEPWISDGTAEGTRMVRDLCPGECGSVPAPLGTLGGEVLFWAATPEHGVELWASDGSAAGTHRLTDLCPGPCGGYHELTPWWNEESGELARIAGAELGGELYFGAFDDVGSGLFATDGSPAGTRLVTRTCSSLCTTVPTALTRVGDRLAFVAAGSQLWWSDGTAAGTRAGPPQCPTGRTTQIEPNLLALGGRVVYPGACGGSFGARPSVFDLLAAEPYGDAVSLARGPVLPVAAVHDGAAWAVLPQAGGQAAELWRSDGTVAGTGLVSTLDLPAPQQLLSAGGHLLLSTYELPSDPRGYEVNLWRLDGDAAPQRLNAGSLPLVAPRAVGERVLWWETSGSLVDFTADAFAWNLVAYGLGSEGDDESAVVQRFRTPRLGPGSLPRQLITPTLAAAGDRLLLSADGGDGQQLWALPRTVLEPPCGSDPRDLCLGDGRFRVRARYRNQHAGGAEGWATALPETPQSGFFWFFRPGNVELMVKLLDGGGVNGHHWVFWGGTTDLGYDLEVADLAAGVTRTYPHAPGDLCGGWDTTAFAAAPPAASSLAAPSAGAAPAAASAAPAPLTPPPCSDGDHAVCLLAHGFGGGLYRVEVSFENQHAGGAAGVATPVLFDPDDRTTAWFWFFRPDNPEVLVKVLDGHAVNGHPWVFVGGLTDLAYEVRVSAPGGVPVRTYRKQAGGRCGVADLSAF